MEKISFPCIDVSNVKALPEIMAEIANGKLNETIIGVRVTDLLKQSEEVQSIRLDIGENSRDHK